MLQARQEARQLRRRWLDGSEKQDVVASGHKHRGEGFDVDVAHRVGFVFDIDPGEPHVGPQHGAFIEHSAPFTADVAPLRAKRDHPPGRVVDATRQAPGDQQDEFGAYRDADVSQDHHEEKPGKSERFDKVDEKVAEVFQKAAASAGRALRRRLQGGI